MNQTALEKRISDKAKNRFRLEAEKLAKLIYNNPIGRRMRIGEIKIASNASDGVFSESSIRDTSYISNYDEIKTQLIEAYETQEMDNILNKLESIQYLFNQE